MQSENPRPIDRLLYQTIGPHLICQPGGRVFVICQDKEKDQALAIIQKKGYELNQ